MSFEKRDPYRFSRLLSILGAAFEYFISILVTGAYLAKITEQLGISDAMTGILNSFVSLGCTFQLIAIFISHTRPVKGWVTTVFSLTQLSFGVIYFIPFIPASEAMKTALFVIFMLIANLISNVAVAPRANWHISLVDDNRRGRYTANKEMVSLIGGMIFSFAMGAVIDKYEAEGNLKGAFIISGVTIFALMLLHSATLIFSKEAVGKRGENTSTKRIIAQLLKDKNMFKVILVSVLWNVVFYSSTPFYGSYQIKELGFSMTFVSLLSAAYAIIRTLFSRPLGKFADKYSFAKMLNICFSVMLVGFIINIFCVPENGRIVFTVYYALHAVAMAGINSAMTNLIFDYADKDKRVGALALRGTLSGLIGFLTTLAITPLVTRIQENGNSFFGIKAYAQQVVSAISALLLVGLIVYLNLVVINIKRKDEITSESDPHQESC